MSLAESDKFIKKSRYVITVIVAIVYFWCYWQLPLNYIIYNGTPRTVYKNQSKQL